MGCLRYLQDYDRWNNEFAHLFYQKPFSSYRLRLEYRFAGDQLTGAQDWAWLNSGVMLHSQSPESMKKNQDFQFLLKCNFSAL